MGPTWISCGLTSRLTGLRWLAKYLAKDAKYANCLFSALSNCISKCNPAGKKNEKIEDCFWILWKCLAIFFLMRRNKFMAISVWASLWMLAGQAGF